MATHEQTRYTGPRFLADIQTVQSLIDINTPDGATLEVWGPQDGEGVFHIEVSGARIGTFTTAQEEILIQATAQRMGTPLPASVRAGMISSLPGEWVADFLTARGERIWVVRSRPETSQSYEIISRGISHHGACDIHAVLRAMAFYAHCEPRAARLA